MVAWEWVLGLYLATTSGQGQPLPEPLPPPRVIHVQVFHPLFPSDEPYGKMSFYSRDRYGYMRPRVISGPYGAYYPATGAPYPYLPVRGIP